MRNTKRSISLCTTGTGVEEDIFNSFLLLHIPAKLPFSLNNTSCRLSAILNHMDEAFQLGRPRQKGAKCLLRQSSLDGRKP